MKEKSIQQQYREFRTKGIENVVGNKKQDLNIHLNNFPIISRIDAISDLNIKEHDLIRAEKEGTINRIVIEKNNYKRIFYYITEISHMVKIS